MAWVPGPRAQDLGSQAHLNCLDCGIHGQLGRSSLSPLYLVRVCRCDGVILQYYPVLILFSLKLHAVSSIALSCLSTKKIISDYIRDADVTNSDH